MRYCYVCGREAPRRVVIEPLLVPVCPDRECALRAARLPDPHCSVRLLEGSICGKPAARQFDAGGYVMCPPHLREFWEHKRVA
jgi:hypothetical protein